LTFPGRTLKLVHAQRRLRIAPNRATPQKLEASLDPRR
jgi:hypothetical protein